MGRAPAYLCGGGERPGSPRRDRGRGPLPPHGGGRFGTERVSNRIPARQGTLGNAVRGSVLRVGRVREATPAPTRRRRQPAALLRGAVPEASVAGPTRHLQRRPHVAEGSSRSLGFRR